MLKRAQGCLMGQLAGDALGSQVEGMTPAAIRKEYPGGVLEMTGGGPWNILPGQPTDDSEMALALARTLMKKGGYHEKAALRAYRSWFRSNPFDIGLTIFSALSGTPKPESQGNGALMRISPLGIFGARHDDFESLAVRAMKDAALTHPHIVCREINALFVIGLAHAIRSGCAPEAVYETMFRWAVEHEFQPVIIAVLRMAADQPPKDYLTKAGWVLISFHNALWRLLHSSSFEEGVAGTVMEGGDADTSGAICGALLGAAHGIDAIPEQWTKTVLECRPAVWKLWIRHARPRRYWPVDGLVLAEKLLR